MTPAVTAPVSLARACWPQMDELGGDALLLVPVGSLEQHGPHLPFDTDTRVATEVVGRAAALLAGTLASRRSDVDLGIVVGPAIAYGASGEHAEFPGTLSIGSTVLVETVVELVRSARRTFAGVVAASAHGGNTDALCRVADRCRAEGDRFLSAGVGVMGGDAHAGRTETSMMLAIDPVAVRMAHAAPGRTEPLALLLPALRAGRFRAVSPSGVLGDPTSADQAEGQRLLQAAAERLADQIRQWWTENEGQG